jgi:hypothetical protein
VGDVCSMPDRNAYDHRLRELVSRTRDLDLAERLGVPRPTARSWLRRGLREVVSADVLDDDAGQLRVRVTTRPNELWHLDVSAPCTALQTGSCNAAPIKGGSMRKGTAKLGWVPTAGLHEQSGLNCTGCGPFAAGRATTGSMVSQRSMRRKPLYLRCNSLRLNGAGRLCDQNRPGFTFWAGEFDLCVLGDGVPPVAIAPDHQG